MARRNPARETRSWSLYPALHPPVQLLLHPHSLSHTFHRDGKPKAALHTHDTHIIGAFRCANTSCAARGWFSKKIPVTIRHFDGDRYSVTVYHQRCCRCGWISRPRLDEDTYAERVAYWLKKWAGVEVERPRARKRGRKPHARELCEGCRLGHCR